MADSHDTTPPAVGARLRDAREYAGLSVGQAAGLLGWDADLVRAHEGGRVLATDLDLARYSRLYDRSVAALHRGSEPVTPEDVPASIRAKFGRLPASDQREVMKFLEHLKNLPPRRAGGGDRG